MLGNVPAGNAHRVAALLEDGHQIGFLQGMAEGGLALFDLRAQVFGKLSEDILLLSLGKPELHGIQVAVEKVGCGHGFSYVVALTGAARIRSRVAFILRHSAWRLARTSSPTGDKR